MPTLVFQDVQVGDLVLVTLDLDGTTRPMLVTFAGMALVYPSSMSHTPTSDFRVSGTIFCEPEDHTLPAFRGAVSKSGDPAAITGRPDRLLPLGYGSSLQHGSGVGQWRPKGDR